MYRERQRVTIANPKAVSRPQTAILFDHFWSSCSQFVRYDNRHGTGDTNRESIHQGRKIHGRLVTGDGN